MARNFGPSSVDFIAAKDSIAIQRATQDLEVSSGRSAAITGSRGLSLAITVQIAPPISAWSYLMLVGNALATSAIALAPPHWMALLAPTYR